MRTLARIWINRLKYFGRLRFLRDLLENQVAIMKLLSASVEQTKTSQRTLQRVERTLFRCESSSKKIEQQLSEAEKYEPIAEQLESMASLLNALEQKVSLLGMRCEEESDCQICPNEPQTMDIDHPHESKHITPDSDMIEGHLLVHLKSFLRNPRAVDVGANRGQFAEHLLQSGFSVNSFEPNENLRNDLQSLVSKYPGRFQFSNWALGNQNKEVPLFSVESSGAGTAINEDLSLFSTTVKHPLIPALTYAEPRTVSMRTMDALIQENIIDPGSSILKIDTEGADYEVLCGLSKGSFEVIMCEFWDRDFCFSQKQTYSLNDIHHEFQRLGYQYVITVYRSNQQEILFSCGNSKTLKNVWGNTLAFKSALLAKAARLWLKERYCEINCP